MSSNSSSMPAGPGYHIYLPRCTYSTGRDANAQRGRWFGYGYGYGGFRTIHILMQFYSTCTVADSPPRELHIYMYYENIPFPTFAQEAGSRPKWRPKHRRPLGKPGDPSLLSAQHVRGPSSPGKRLFPARGRRGSRPSTQRLVPAQAPSACKYSNAAPFLFSTTCVLAIANSENMQSDSVETNSVYREAQARWRAHTLVIHVL